MSRIGRKILTIPENVKINIGADSVEVEGPKGKLKQKINPLVKVEIKGKTELIVVKLKETNLSDAQPGVARA